MERERGVVGRSSLVLAAVAVGVAVAGFLYGVRPVEHAAPLPPTGGAPGGEVLPGRTYAELRLRRIGAGSRLTSDPAGLRAGLPAHDPADVRTEEERTAAIGARAERRAFDGAPPVVPHAVDELSSVACPTCHARGMAVAGVAAPVMSHEPYASCLQCHAPAWGRRAEPWDRAVTTFVGLASPGPGARAWPGAPPAMPHPSWMRGACGSCHGSAGLAGLRTPHPERQGCPQCHAPRAELERLGAGDEGPRR